MDSGEEWPSHGLTTSKRTFSTKNKCKFCAAFFIDEVSCSAHSENCLARLSAFLASDGRIKFACMVCRDVFDDPAELSQHEQLHKYPGGFGCTICNETFLSEADSVSHAEDVHQAFKCLRCENEVLISTEVSYIEHCEREHNGEGGYAICLECGASFEEKSHLRFHRETECGHFRGWTCPQCGAIFKSENALSEHIDGHLSNGIKCKLEFDYIPPLEFASIECTTNLHAAYDPMEIDRSQYSDDVLVQPPYETLNVVKVEAFDLNHGEMAGDEEQLYDNVGGSESEYENEATASDDNKSEENTKKCKKSQRLSNSISCKFCGSTFARNTNLQRHLRKQHLHEVEKNENGQNGNECDFCGRCYSAPQHLEQHVRDMHAKYECDKCGIGLMLKKHLRQHFASVCGRKSLNVCVVCKKSFDSADELKAHKVSHKVNECKLCDGSFPTLKELKAHARMHRSTTCPICDKSYDNFQQWNRHLRAHRNASSFQCKYCDQKFTRKVQMVAHMAKHTGAKSFQCLACDERFVTLTKLQSHRKSRNTTCGLVQLKSEYLREAGVQEPNDSIEEKSSNDIDDDQSGSTTAKVKLKETSRECVNDLVYVCGICDRKYAQKKGLEKHVVLHGPDGKLVYKCDCCPKYFASIEESDEHKNEVHMDQLTCPHCKKVLKNVDALKAHLLRIHQEKTKEKTKVNPKHICSKCGAILTTKFLLEKHEKSDCGRNPIYKCDHCGKCLGTEYIYRDHLKLHQDNTKTFICSYCGKAWRTKTQLKTHQRYHTGERPFECGYCDKKFFDGTSKKTHESTHTGIKPYMCQCGDRFSCISNLQSHRRKTTCGLLPLISKAFPKMTPGYFDSPS